MGVCLGGVCWIDHPENRNDLDIEDVNLDLGHTVSASLKIADRLTYC